MENSLSSAMIAVAPAKGLPLDDFESLVRAHQTRIFRVLWSELRDADAAANLTQECFLRAFEHRQSFRGEADVSTWLVRIALNLAHDFRRNRRQNFWQNVMQKSDPEAEASGIPSREPSAERVLLGREQADQVMALVTALPEQQRTAFLLRFVEELSLEEIAVIMGLEVGTVKSHLSRSVAALRRQFPRGGTKDSL